MAKLLLTSAGFTNPRLGQEFIRLAGKSASEIRIIFIPTASRTEHELEYVEIAKKQLFDIGIKKNNLLVFKLDKSLTYKDVRNYDAVYVCGGNTFYLLAKIRESGFGEVIKKLVLAGKVYVGVSAGSLLAGPDVESAVGFDENDAGVKDFKALGLTNTVTYVHYTEEERSLFEKVKCMYKGRFPVISLTNSQALVVEGNKEKIVE